MTDLLIGVKVWGKGKGLGRDSRGLSERCDGGDDRAGERVDDERAWGGVVEERAGGVDPFLPTFESGWSSANQNILYYIRYIYIERESFHIEFASY